MLIVLILDNIFYLSYNEHLGNCHKLNGIFLLDNMQYIHCSYSWYLYFGEGCTLQNDARMLMGRHENGVMLCSYYISGYLICREGGRPITAEANSPVCARCHCRLPHFNCFHFPPCGKLLIGVSVRRRVTTRTYLTCPYYYS